MDILNIFYDEILRFFSLAPLINLIKTGQYDTLLTLQGIKTVMSPLIPFLLVIEIGRGLLERKFHGNEVRIPLLVYVFNRFVSRFVAIAVTAYCIGLWTPIAVFKTEFTWYWFIYGYVVWELGHYIYHWLGHKVRLFWCLHSTHHAPENMNLSVTYSHFFLEAPYADVIRTSVCILLGVNPPMLYFIMFVDGMWGSFIHIGEGMMKTGRMGFMEKFILSPMHHRVHHAKNPLYMDTNFCNLLNIWDRIFGTHQDEHPNIPIQYGITRQIDPNNFWDVYFGEFVALFKDIYAANGLKNKLLYIVMPPGWSHTGAHRTAKIVREEFTSALKLPRKK